MPRRTTTLTPSAPLIQGIASPDVRVDPAGFYAATRRMRYPMQPLKAIAGLGTTDPVQLRQTGIVDQLEIRVTGTLTFGGVITGTIMSWEWPFNLIREVKLSANGQSNLTKVRGLTLRALEFIRLADLNDNGLDVSVDGTVREAGHFMLPCDDWGTSGADLLRPSEAVPAVGTYTVDLTFVVPVSADAVSLIGSIYAQSSATNLSLDIQWASQAEILEALGGTATFASALNWSVWGRVYSIPNVGGEYLVPDLSQFHQVIENRHGGLVQGTNGIPLPGSGIGRRLLRLLHNVYSGVGSAAAPLAMNGANFNRLAWAYGGSDTPEAYDSGSLLRAENIRVTGTDIGGVWGFGLWDWASQFALRDTVDQGATADLRAEIGLVAPPTSGAAQVTQELLFAAPVGA